MSDKAKIRYGVQCLKHGVESALWAGKMVVVPRPKNKRGRMSGCPVCAAEAKRAAVQQREAAT